MSMKKLCKKCGIEKNLTQFYKRPDMKDGYLNHCKVCNSFYQKKYKKKKSEESPEEPRMAATTKRDWCLAFRWLEIMGYDLEKDIHQQFIEKHNIKKYKNRPSKNNRRYEPSDCIKKK